MPEVRLLAPVTDDDGKEHAAGEVLDVDEETARALQASGKVSLVSDEQKQTEQGGHYTDVTTREDVAPLTPGGSTPGPQAEDEADEEDKPKGKK
jgi:hypothetical protein